MPIQFDQRLRHIQDALSRMWFVARLRVVGNRPQHEHKLLKICDLSEQVYSYRASSATKRKV